MPILFEFGSVPTPRPTRARGSVFLLCLFVALAMFLAASSFAMAALNRVEISRDDNAGLQADLMAESAASYAMRQLLLNQNWKGVGAPGVQVPGVGSFEVQLLGAGANGGTVARMTGRGGGSMVVLEGEIDLDDGGPSDIVRACGLITYGGSVDTNNLKVTKGGALLVDDDDKVMDYDPATQKWQPALLNQITLTANNVDVAGTLYTYGSPLKAVKAGARATMTDAIRTPALNLDSFLVPNPKTTIMTATTLKNINTTKTVVLKVPVGKHINITNCQFKGGLVVYSEGKYTARSAPRNTIEWDKSTFGSATATGVMADIGILAPAAHVTHSHTQTSGHGLFYVKSADHLNAITITGGAIMVLGSIAQMNNVNIAYDPTIWNSQLLSLFNFGPSSSRVLGLHEYYAQK